MTNLLDGEGWVHVPDNNLGWVFKRGDGWFFSDTGQNWEYLPHLLTPAGVLTDPPPVPLQARARHAAQTVATRLTSGPVLPLTSTEPLVEVLPRQLRQPGQRRWETTPPPIKILPPHERPRAMMDDSNIAHAHGWPTWHDAWGEKGKRPGGLIRAVLRGVCRLAVYGGLPLVALSALVGMFTASSPSGADGAIGIFIMGVIPIAAAMFIAAPILWINRCWDFDPAKGLTASMVYIGLMRLWRITHPRKPFVSMGNGQFGGNPNAPYGSQQQFYNGGVKPPWT